MKDCTDCKRAKWDRTKNNRLHPSGKGVCYFTYKIPVLPESMDWINKPTVCGGQISRRKKLKNHCLYYEAK